MQYLEVRIQMKIAICDDEISVLHEIKSLLAEYCTRYDREISCDVFQSPLELLTKMEQSGCYDALFLDILMNEDNGIEVARELRKTDEDVKIIFLTSSPEFAVQSYTVGAFYYELKPVSKESFFKLMDKLYSEWTKERAEFLIVKCENGINKIDVRDLEYCEVVNRSLVICLTNGISLKSAAKITEIEKMLGRFGCFIRPHRSYIVNLRHIKNISQKTIIMKSGAKIPIPHGKYTQTKEQYLEYAFENMAFNNVTF